MHLRKYMTNKRSGVWDKHRQSTRILDKYSRPMKTLYVMQSNSSLKASFLLSFFRRRIYIAWRKLGNYLLWYFIGYHGKLIHSIGKREGRRQENNVKTKQKTFTTSVEYTYEQYNTWISATAYTVNLADKHKFITIFGLELCELGILT